MKLLLIALFCLGHVSLIEGKTQCVDARGRVECDKDPSRNVDVQISMMDIDGLPWEQDDTMGLGWSNLKGEFSVEGCGYDFGPWNTPDPVLRLSHRCHDRNLSHWKTMEIKIWEKWAPEITEVGLIKLDDQGDWD